jgi:pSer/pThr/pTyr-binding forkhead associated (FHA) protein
MVGELICQNCGEILLPGSERMLNTRPLGPGGALHALPVLERGTKTFPPNAKLVLDFARSTPRVITFNGQEEITFARVDRFTTILPTINLTPLCAWERGVSRLHAAIRRSGGHLYVVDLDSTNSTFLNGERLLPREPRMLCSGDQLRLGLFGVTVHFLKDEAA